MSQISSFQKLEHWLQQQVIGQPTLVNRLLVALLADGHLLVEGAPGLAKTRAIHVLGQHLESDYQRIQFTPDLLPADITGTDIFSQQESKFHFQPGPLFHNLILADEINRAPAKVQSALLEAMAERQVTVAGVTRRLPEPFLVMATQNPIEQEGTYPLPEAQLDRFLLHVLVDYPEREHEKQILHLVRGEVRQQLADETPAGRGIVSKMDIKQARQQVVDTYLSQPVEDYLIQLVLATRKPQSYGEELAGWIAWGASPRATLALDRCARARAWLAGRDYVGPEDIQAMAHDVLRHRILLNYEAEAEGITTDHVIDQLLQKIAVP
jgi:MoxR-like ATPase